VRFRYGLTGAYEGNLGCWLARPIWDALQLRGLATVTHALATTQVKSLAASSSGGATSSSGDGGHLHHVLSGAHQIFDLDMCRTTAHSLHSLSCTLSNVGQCMTLTALHCVCCRCRAWPPSPHSHSCLLADVVSRAPASLRERSFSGLYAVWSYLLTHTEQAQQRQQQHKAGPVGSVDGAEGRASDVHIERRRAHELAGPRWMGKPAPHAHVSCAPWRANASGHVFLDEDGRLMQPSSQA
jgi:hypothetical protein